MLNCSVHKLQAISQVLDKAGRGNKLLTPAGFRAEVGWMVEPLPAVPGVLSWRKDLLGRQSWQKPLGEPAREKC